MMMVIWSFVKFGKSTKLIKSPMFATILQKIGIIKSNFFGAFIWIKISQNPEFEVSAMNRLDLRAISKFGVLSIYLRYLAAQVTVNLGCVKEKVFSLSL